MGVYFPFKKWYISYFKNEKTLFVSFSQLYVIKI